MLHAGVLMKLGAYGILAAGIRILPHGAVHWAPVFAVLAAVGVVYGAFVAMRQSDFKFVVGFSSVSHMGIVILGLNLAVLGKAGADALNGAVFQMFAHGIMTALFFSIVGFIYDRSHSKTISDFGGPRLADAAGRLGLHRRRPVRRRHAGAGQLLGRAARLPRGPQDLPGPGGGRHRRPRAHRGLRLRVFSLAFFGPVNERWNGLRHLDLAGVHLVPRAILIAVLLFFGFYPRALLDVIDGTTAAMIAGFR